MYHQVRLKKTCWSLFGFSYTDLTGKTRYYCYKCLPFGITSAVFLVDQLIKPIKIYMHQIACDLSVYIDDGLVVEKSYNRCFAAYKFSIFVLRKAGWTLQDKKCSREPTTSLVYLGFHLDAPTQRITAPELKVDRVYYYTSQILSAHKTGQIISNRLTAKFLGQLCALHYSHGTFTRIISRRVMFFL